VNRFSLPACVALAITALMLLTTSADAATELNYSGTLTQIVRGGNTTPVKQFDLYVLQRATDSGSRIFHLINERGGGGWSWPERFGEQILDSSHRPSEGRPAHALHVHDGTKYPIELATPLFADASKLAQDANWESGSLKYSVSRQRKVGDRNCWQVDAVDRFGRRQTFLVDQSDATVVAAERRVFMGRGDEFLLKMELASTRAVPADKTEKLTNAVDGLLSLQAALKREAGDVKAELSAEQLKVTSDAIGGLIADSAGTPLKSLVDSASRDARSQSQRVSDVENLARKLVGSPAPEWQFTTLRKQTVSSETQKGRVTVLHFWDYQGEPLEEPYGQVGYLDFLLNRRGRLGLDVVGVAVNESFLNPIQSGAAARSARKLQQFMNLSYPIGTDSGAMLKKFGDPSALDAKLPVWVVIDHKGQIAHFHAGLYPINPDEGLQELDAVVVKLIKAQRESAN
jgi:hypothetical protein